MAVGAFLMSREIFDSYIYSDVTKFRIFFHIIGHAVFSEEGVQKGDIHVKRGQYLRSLRNLREDLVYYENNSEKMYSLSTLNRKLGELIEEGRLTVENTKLGTLFTVVNYAKYQDFEHYRGHNLEQQKNSNRTAKEQRENTKRTVKEQRENTKRTVKEQQQNNNNKENKDIKGNKDIKDNHEMKENHDNNGNYDDNEKKEKKEKESFKPPPASSITNGVNREKEEKTSSKEVGGRSVSSLDAVKNSSANNVGERLEKIIGHYTCTFGEPTGGALEVLKFMAAYYKDVPLICEAITVIDEYNLSPNEPYSEILRIVKHWKDQLINSYAQLEEKKQHPQFTLLPSDEVVST